MFYLTLTSEWNIIKKNNSNMMLKEKTQEDCVVDHCDHSVWQTHERNEGSVI